MKTDLPKLLFWSLNDDLKPDEMLIQMKEMKKEGFTGFFLHARAGLKVAYMSEEWFSIIEAALKAARELGLQAWLYDENGWPSGMADGMVPSESRLFCQKTLRYVWLKKGDDLPDNVLGVYFPDGRYLSDWDTYDGERLVFYYVINENYSDILYPEAVNLFVKLTHERYKERFGQYFGNVIPGIFTDEPQMSFMQLPWSTGLEKVFEETYGYSLIEKLPLIVLDEPGYHALRHDFWKLVSRRYTTVFMKTIYDWCQDNNLLFTGHLSNEDSPLWQMSAVGSVMPNYRYFQIPGIDHLGNRITSPVLMKQLSSVARQFKKDRVLCECFGCSGWNISFQDIIWMWGWMAFYGVNIPCFHLFAYSMKGCRKRDYPAFFSPQEPWWDKIHHLVGKMDEISAFLDGAESTAEVLVLHPESSIWCLGVPDGSDEMGSVSNSFRILTENLLSLGVEFDYGDEWLLETHGRVEGNRIVLGACSYKLVVVPPSLSLEKTTVELLARFLEAGGKVLFVDTVPKLVEGRSKAPDWRQMGNTAFCGNRRNLLERQTVLMECRPPVRILDRNGNENPDGIYRTAVKKNDEYRIFLWNTSRSENREFRLMAGSGQRIFDESGMPVEMENGGAVSEPLKLPAQSVRMFIFRDKAAERIGVLKQKYRKVCFIHPACQWKAAFDKPNSITIDMASWREGNGEYSEEMPIPDIQRKVFERAYNATGPLDITVRYKFYLSGGFAGPITLAAETEDTRELRVNGIPVTFSGWIIDKSLHTANLDPNMLREGENAVEAVYTLDVYDGYLSLDGIFESIRNKFAFPIEIESIYLFGDFSAVPAAGNIQRMPNYVRVDTTHFVLSLPQEEQNICGSQLKDCLWKFNRWFYRGNVVFESSFTLAGDADRIFVRIGRVHGAGAQISVNGSKPQVTFGNGELDVTSQVHSGENSIRVEVWGNNRNLLGPHHHIAAEERFIGPSMWEGRRGWEDIYTPGSDDITRIGAYNFVPVGLEEEPVIVQLWL